MRQEAPQKVDLGLTKALENHVDIILGCEVGSIEKIDIGNASCRWRVFSKQLDSPQEVLGEFDWILSAAPSAQTEALFTNTAFNHLDRLRDAVHLPALA
ncbi:hypothetical protein N9J86_04595 [Gammaproteobacteria bacterium]|nr:hypothetical protein [Gammaproteobacteria bacterium]